MSYVRWLPWHLEPKIGLSSTGHLSDNISMTTVCLTLATLLTWFWAIAPIRRFKQAQAQAKCEQRYHNFKLYAVRHYHPAFRNNDALAKLSYREIEKLFDIDRSYDDIS